MTAFGLCALLDEGGYVIRIADERDVEAVIRIWKEGITSAIGRTAVDVDQLEDFFLQRILSASSPFGFWVACAPDGAVIGWQALLPFDNNPATRTFFAEASTYVAKEAARHGVGEALIRHAMAFAAEGSLQYVIGFISGENHGAQAMVKKCGWKLVGDIPAASKAPTTPGSAVFVFLPPSLTDILS